VGVAKKVRGRPRSGGGTGPAASRRAARPAGAPGCSVGRAGAPVGGLLRLGPRQQVRRDAKHAADGRAAEQVERRRARRAVRVAQQVGRRRQAQRGARLWGAGRWQDVESKSGASVWCRRRVRPARAPGRQRPRPFPRGRNRTGGASLTAQKASTRFWPGQGERRSSGGRAWRHGASGLFLLRAAGPPTRRSRAPAPTLRDTTLAEHTRRRPRAKGAGSVGGPPSLPPPKPPCPPPLSAPPHPRCSTGGRPGPPRRRGLWWCACPGPARLKRRAGWGVGCVCTCRQQGRVQLCVHLCTRVPVRPCDAVCISGRLCVRVCMRPACARARAWHVRA
jgi:hypothetical protein